MKKGDKVYVNWNGSKRNKDGPFVLDYYGFDHAQVDAGGERVVIPSWWCETAEPEIEEGRLVYVVSESDNFSFVDRYIKNGYERGHRYIPVHRRVNELTSEQIDEWVNVWEDYKTYDALDALKAAYEIITGEEHP